MRAKRILIVDDEDAIVDSIRGFLEDEGYAVVVARDGVEALARLRTEPSLSLILLDLRMPNMSGYEFRGRQLEDPALARVPVVVVTAEPQKSVEAAGFGAVSILTKPFSGDSLLEIVRSHAV
jgi:CheY-like chemotaxis protein